MLNFRSSISFDVDLNDTVLHFGQDEYLLCDLLVRNKLNVDNECRNPAVISKCTGVGWDVKIEREVYVSPTDTNAVYFDSHFNIEFKRPITDFFLSKLSLSPNKLDSKLICIHLINLPKLASSVEIEISIEDFEKRRNGKRIKFQRNNDKILLIQKHFCRKGLF